MEASGSYLVLPAIVGLETVGDLSLHIMRKFEVSFGDFKLGVDFIDSYAVVHKTEEADGLGRLEQLLDNLGPAVVEI